jgi:hypothetical protein
VPDGADFIVEFRSTHRLFFYCDSEATRDRLMVDLEEFAPHFDETAEATQSLAATHPTLAPEKSGFEKLRLHVWATVLRVRVRTVSRLFVNSEVTLEQLSRPPLALVGQQHRLGLTLRV